jgi:prepilin-type N-terminal cleavage/methylation domain-containing protein/prepilin-type processing-associated H-X9-DG protein
MRQNGFTLVEILVVMAVLAILAGILLPVLARARAAARTTACVSNQRQLGAAFGLYAQDYDGRLPDFHSDPISAASATDLPFWHDRFCRGLSLAPNEVSFLMLLEPDLRSVAVAFCPVDGDRAAGGRTVTSYEYKLWLAEGRTLAQVPYPAGTALLWEQWAYHAADPHASEYDRRAAMNVLFVDGHVRWRRLSDASTARYGSGPNLHGLFQEGLPADPLYGRDFPD